MDLTSRMFWAGATTGPVRWKAMIWRLSGLTIEELMRPIGPPAWTLKTGVLIRRELYTNIILLYHIFGKRGSVFDVVITDFGATEDSEVGAGA